MGNRKRDVYPTKYFTASAFPETSMVLQIEMSRREEFKNDGKATEKLVTYFHGQKSGLPVGPTLWDQIADVAVAAGIDKSDSDDYTKWPGLWVELYRDKTRFGGDIVNCIRVRAPATTPPPPKGKAKKPWKKAPPSTDFDDSVDV